MADKLTAKQQAWIDYYKQGYTATDAARLAGYKATSDKAYQNIGSENLGKLGQYVKDREEVLGGPRIATMEEVNAFWSEVMRSEKEKTCDRLKASELRARASGAFLDRVEHRGEVGVQVEMSLSDKMAAIKEAVDSYGR